MKKIFLCILTLTLFALVACSKETTNEQKSEPFTSKDLKIENKYDNGYLISTVKSPDKKTKLNIVLSLSMKNMDHEIKSNPRFIQKGDIYTAKVQIPMEGIWDLEYNVKNGSKTIVNTYTETFGKVPEEQQNQYTADLNVNPEPIKPNQNTTFTLKLTDKKSELMKNTHVTLVFHSNNEHIEKEMANKDGIHSAIIKFKSKDNYHLTINIIDKTKNKVYEEEAEIPVGVDEEESTESSEHENH